MTTTRRSAGADRPVAREATAAARRRRRGFTLVELMIVVAIIAVLAAIGSYAYGRMVKRGRINEAITFFAGLNGAQTAYYNHYYQYGATDTSAPFDNYEPALAAIQGKASDWAGASAAWTQIGVRLPPATHFQYVVVAGNPSSICAPPPDVTVDSATYAVPACASVTNGTDWYYVVGRADQDGDGQVSVFGSSNAMQGQHWSVEPIDLE